jgi:hypothetical protein
MQTRRQFLLHGVHGLGAWLIASRLASTIERHLKEQGDPYLIPVQKPSTIIVASSWGSDYSLTIEPPDDFEPEKLTWEQWLQNESIDSDNLQQVREHFIYNGLFDPDDDEEFEIPDLSDFIEDQLQEQHDEWMGERHDSPGARAYHYLSELPLGNRKPSGTTAFGELRFYDGICPGNDGLAVIAKNAATISYLQHRLIQLGEDVEIVIQ